MKTKELTGYGVTGIRVELNLMDRYAAGQALDHAKQLLETISNEEDFEKISFILTGEVISFLGAVSHLLEKLALNPSEESSIFDPIEDEPVEKKEC